MKIIQVIQKPQCRGAEIFATQLSIHLRNQGHSVLMVSVFAGDISLPFTGEMIQMDLKPANRFWELSGWAKLAAIIRDFQPDIIQANAADTLKFTVFSKLFFRWRVPVIYRNANMTSGFINGRLKYYFNWILVSNLSGVISVSQRCHLDFLKLFHLPADRSVVIPIGVESNSLLPVPDDLQKLFSAGPVFLHVGEMVPEKNHMGLLRIFSSIHQQFPESRLLLVGTGKLESHLRQMAFDLDLGSAVFFAGSRTDVSAIMAHCKILLLPSLIEGLPAVILEAMAVGCPVVANDTGGISEVVHDRETGLLVPKDNEQQFVNAAISLLTDEQLARKISDAARIMVHKNYDNTVIASRFEAAYKKLSAGVHR